MRSNDSKIQTAFSRKISVIVPCFNEDEAIRATHERLNEVMSGLDYPYEIIYVDDGSADNTPHILEELTINSDLIRVITLSRNFGHQTAITAGIDNAVGDAIVLIDADLQDPPELIGSMIRKWESGADVVYGVRLSRDGESWSKRETARLFYRFVNLLSEISIPLDTGDFRLLDRRVADTFREMRERDRYIRGLIPWLGYRQEPLYYHRKARYSGGTKYTSAKMVRLSADAIFSMSRKPLQLATLIGVVVWFISILGIFYVLYLRIFTESWVPGWTVIVVSLLFLGGLQLFFLGIVGEYIARIYTETKGRPLYVIKKRR